MEDHKCLLWNTLSLSTVTDYFILNKLLNYLKVFKTQFSLTKTETKCICVYILDSKEAPMAPCSFSHYVSLTERILKMLRSELIFVGGMLSSSEDVSLHLWAFSFPAMRMKSPWDVSICILILKTPILGKGRETCALLAISVSVNPAAKIHSLRLMVSPFPQ